MCIIENAKCIHFYITDVVSLAFTNSDITYYNPVICTGCTGKGKQQIYLRDKEGITNIKSISSGRYVQKFEKFVVFTTLL